MHLKDRTENFKVVGGWGHLNCSISVAAPVILPVIQLYELRFNRIGKAAARYFPVRASSHFLKLFAFLSTSSLKCTWKFNFESKSYYVFSLFVYDLKSLRILVTETSTRVFWRFICFYFIIKLIIFLENVFKIFFSLIMSLLLY